MNSMSWWIKTLNLHLTLALFQLQSNLAISNSVKSKSPLVRSQAESPLFDRHWMLTQLFRNPAISNFYSCPVELRNSEVWLFDNLCKLNILYTRVPLKGKSGTIFCWRCDAKNKACIQCHSMRDARYPHVPRSTLDTRCPMRARRGELTFRRHCMQRHVWYQELIIYHGFQRLPMQGTTHLKVTGGNSKTERELQVSLCWMIIIFSFLDSWVNPFLGMKYTSLWKWSNKRVVVSGWW